MVRDIIILIKFPYHVTFVTVIFGALLFAPRIDHTLAWRLSALYVSFNVLLYGGLYTLNDLADRESDRSHPKKQSRPIASGRVSVRAGWLIALVLLALGVGTGLMLGRVVFWHYIAVVAVNLAYSTRGRNVPYLDVVLNAAPHVFRFRMGAALVDGEPPLTHLVALCLMAIAFSCLRRRVEQDVPGWDARQSLRRWTAGELDTVMVGALVGLVFVMFWKGHSAPGFYSALAGTTLVLMGGSHAAPPIRHALRWVWTR